MRDVHILPETGGEKRAPGSVAKGRSCFSGYASRRRGVVIEAEKGITILTDALHRRSSNAEKRGGGA